VTRHWADPLNVAFAIGLALVGLYMLAPIIFVVVNSFNFAGTRMRCLFRASAVPF